MLVFSKFVIANIYFLFPTILLGASFPLASSLLVKKLENTGKDIGILYSADLLGAIIGAVLTGFFLIPIVGLKNVKLANVQRKLPTLTGIRKKYLFGISASKTIILDAIKLLTDKSLIVTNRIATKV